MARPSAGFTLLELLLVLALVVVLSAVAAPGLGSAVYNQQGEVVIDAVARLFAYARSEAVLRAQAITVCRSGDDLQCKGGWEQGALVFVDLDANGLFDGADILLRRFPLPQGSGSLVLRSFPNRQSVQFSANGFTRGQNGNFTWCPPDHNAALARQLIFTQTGRVRFARDSNGDGLREGADGKALVCS